MAVAISKLRSVDPGESTEIAISVPAPKQGAPRKPQKHKVSISFMYAMIFSHLGTALIAGSAAAYGAIQMSVYQADTMQKQVLNTTVARTLLNASGGDAKQ